MATNILMPALSPTMTEGTLARWLKKEGETIKAGDVIAEIETDKATMEVEAVDEGVLGKILVEDGTAGVAVNAPIAVLVDEGEAVPSGGASPASAPAPKAPPAPTPQAQAAAPQPQAAKPPPHANGRAADSERVFASPLARRMAKQAGLDLSALKGSGPNGRIIRADIEAAQTGGTAKAAPAAAGAPTPAAAPTAAPAMARAPAPAITAPHTLVQHTTMRKVIAKRLSESTATIPHFYVSMDINLDAMIGLLAQLNAKSPPRDAPGAYVVTINDMVIKDAAA